MTLSVSIPDKHIEAMTLAELQHERAGWDNFIERGDGWGMALGIAIEYRTKCDHLIAQRMHEQAQERAA